MADALVARPGFRDLQVRYVDMGDQTWAEKIVAVNPDGSNIGGGGGGAGAQIGIQVRNAGDTAWDNVGPSAGRSRVPVEAYVGAAAIDPRSIRALTSADVVDVADRAARLLGHVTVDNASIPVTDNAGSLTVDAPVGTPVAVRLSDGAAFIDPRDVSDRAARLVGRVYGSQGQQITQTATNFNTQVEVAVGGTLIDPRSIRALTTADAVNVGQWIGSAAPTVGSKTSANSIPVVIASDQGAVNVAVVAGDVDHDVANTLKVVQIGGQASPVDLPPTAVNATGDRVRIWLDRFGSQVMRRRKIRESYTAVCRLAEAAARLDQTFTHVANTNKQWATLHHAATATKEIRLQQVKAYITAWSVATQGVLELRELSATTAPATGNPAITPRPHRIGTGAAEATCLYLPTTQGSEAAVNSPLGHAVIDYGIMGAVSTVNPMPLVSAFVLYDASQEDDEVLQPTAPVGVYGGWAVMLRTVGIPAVRMTVLWKFTEEIP